jgi:hypothetical protein
MAARSSRVSPAVGSSRRRTVGSRARTMASSRACLAPWDRCPARSSSRGSSPDTWTVWKAGSGSPSVSELRQNEEAAR